MKYPTVDEIRDLYLNFFRDKQHKILPSASLIPHGDPTLLLTVAGMVPFKHYFLGLEKPESKRVTTCQRCIRTADIDNVGKTDRHATFFEMLGNFSFGDYFKAEVIPWAWEFVTEHLQFPPEKLWVSVFQDDDEAYDIWTKVVGIPAERIVRLGKADNFWETGHGPCGPCSEIYLDRGPEYGCGSDDCKPGCDCERYLEFWNLVFIQFHQEGDKYTPLEKRSIDTGMGLERVAALMQGTTSIFEIDNMRPIVDGIGRMAGKTYGSDAQADVSLRVIADHLRAVSFLVMDGVLPSNEGRGYVLRRLIRRAVRHGRLLGIKPAFLDAGIDLVVEQMGKAYPELSSRLDYIKRVVSLEEERFNQTLDQGMHLLQELVEEAQAAQATTISGRAAFQLYDTFGFPLELTTEILAEKGLALNEDEFREAMEAQRQRARAARGEQGYLDSSLEVFQDIAGNLEVRFSGYEVTADRGRIVAIIRDNAVVEQAVEGDNAAVVLDVTPFYAESGGQVSDAGWITAPTGKMRVEDVRHPVEGLIVHVGQVVDGVLQVNSEVSTAVDAVDRMHTARHHTATHLLHKALKDLLGEHVNQAGSYVGPDRLRFDFTHFEAVDQGLLRQIEDQVNQAILANYPVEIAYKSLEEAKAEGAVALFGEKYGARVRVIRIGDYSMELCGGTHVRATGDIGMFRILSEGSVASGVRRIEAVAGVQALAYARHQEDLLREMGGTLGTANLEELPQHLKRLAEHAKELEKQVQALKGQTIAAMSEDLLAGAEDIAGVRVLVAEVSSVSAEELRDLGDRLRDKLGNAAVVLGTRTEDKVLFLAMVAKALAGKGLHAGKIVQQAAKVCGGGGGGRPDMAQAGGRVPEKLPEALAEAKRVLVSQIEGI
ncbi:MAG: alanine--tRNA ligase [Firmicutes bacterium]|jgi:alanyl-tRNA synthetase|nr:alanine--tRNA ligase [Bacillota bacterium]